MRESQFAQGRSQFAQAAPMFDLALEICQDYGNGLQDLLYGAKMLHLSVDRVRLFLNTAQ